MSPHLETESATRAAVSSIDQPAPRDHSEDLDFVDTDRETRGLDEPTDIEARNRASRFSVLIISRHTLLREGLKALIADMPFKLRFERETIKSAIDPSLRDVALCLVGVRLGNHSAEPLKLLRSTYPHARIVCYTPQVNLPFPVLSGIFESSLDGCVLSTLPLHAIRQSIDLVMMGESVFPFSLLLASVPNQNRGTELAPSAAFGETLSVRELQVLSILQNGKTNKSIARELGLSEATVKVHVKNVLHKLGVSNRTEAAIWMTTHRDHGSEQPGRSLENAIAESVDWPRDEV